MLSTPILFLVFNRPGTTEQVFEVIRQVKPKTLFIAADGPRIEKEGEIDKCNQVKAIVSKVDWECEVKTLFRSENLGCKYAVSSAISWFFDNVEEGIILEDDCLPDLSFFGFCEKLLSYYRYNDNVMLIAGNNYLPKKRRNDDSYYFSAYPSIWGWASWRRAWKLYDREMNNFSIGETNQFLEKVIHTKSEQKYWIDIFEKTYKNEIDTWDYQWYYSLFKHHGLSIKPNRNLVKNLGFGIEATHTFVSPTGLDNLKLETIDLLKFKHPEILGTNANWDYYEYKKAHNTITLMNQIRTIAYKVLPDSLMFYYRKLKKNMK